MTGFGLLEINNHVAHRYCTSPWDVNNAACQGGQIRVEVQLSGVAGAALCVHSCVPASPKGQRVITGLKVVMGNMLYVTLSTIQTEV